MMDTTATNKRVREIINDLEQRKLVPNPDFQRRLVWSQKHKSDFIKTILDGLPFPEIYTAAGDVNVDTAHGYSMLVDGQQRVSTIFEYFNDSRNLQLSPDILPYSQLSNEEKRNFLEYKVVVRDLGELPRSEIIDIFERINSTSYSLNAIEIANARYDNELKDLAERISRIDFWENNSIFRLNEVKRMQDLSFCLVLITTMLTDYYNRDDRVEEFLIRYNDGFDRSSEIESECETVLGFVGDLNLPQGTRAWQRADLFTLLVEVHRALFKDKIRLLQRKLRNDLLQFYNGIESIRTKGGRQIQLDIQNDELVSGLGKVDLEDYYKATNDATNDRGNRIQRGVILRRVICNINDSPA